MGNMVFKGKDDGSQLSVVIAGDSIIHQARFMRWIEHMYATRFPDENIVFYSKGIGGDTSQDIIDRLDWDILNPDDYVPNPDVLIVHIAANDIRWQRYLIKEGELAGNYNITDEAKNCVKNCGSLMDLVESRNIKYIPLTPVFCDDSKQLNISDGANIQSGYVAKGIRELAREKNLGVIDLHKGTTRMNETIRANKPEIKIALTDVSVHPNDEGAVIAAYVFLSEQGAPKVVAETEIDASTGAVVSNNAEISGVIASPTGVTYTYKPLSLPLAVVNEYKTVENTLGVNITDEFNNEVIRVKNLSAGTYRVSAKGVELGIYTAEKLANGINIATNDNYCGQKLAKKIYDLNKTKTSAETGAMDIVAEERWLRGNGVDISNLTEVENWISTNRAAYANTNSWWTKKVFGIGYESYTQIKNKEEQIWNTVNDCIDSIKAKQQYEAFEMRIEKQ